MTRPCDGPTAAGRLRKAIQFFEAAQNVGVLADDEAEARDGVVTLFVHAGIAASDFICCRALGQYAGGSKSHDAAIRLLRSVRHPDGGESSKCLEKLLRVKTKAGYTHRPVTADERKRAERAAQDLVEAARAMT